ncbi:hypothetical protein CDAR_308621, partial [Caerostris darwini]
NAAVIGRRGEKESLTFRIPLTETGAFADETKRKKRTLQSEKKKGRG